MNARRGPRPPLLGRLLLRLRRLGDRREEAEADLEELFQQRLAERGRWYAAFRYCVDVVSFWIHRPGSHVGAATAVVSDSKAPPRAWGVGLDGWLLDARYAVASSGSKQASSR